MTHAPIGVFDSGLGGLTVVRALMDRLPHESVIYVGDTARVPYGPKSPDTVRRYSREIAAYLYGEGVKALVVACNTATAHALDTLGTAVDVPVIGVIDPGARAAVRATRGGPVGVIGTAGTIASGAYERAIEALASDVEVIAAPCPLFVPLVEEGWLDTDATRLIAHTYLAPLAAARIDTLVLGCTHYPLLKPQIATQLPGVTLIDSADETAAETCATLLRLDLAAPATASATYRFVASDAPDHFRRAAQRFLGLSPTVHAVEHVNFG